MSTGLGKMAIIAAALLANTAAGAALVLADERSGTAHLSATEAADTGYDDGTTTPVAAVPAAPANAPLVTAASALPERVTTPRAAAGGAALADAGMVIRRILPVDGPIAYGKWYWDTAGVPAGAIIITVDLDARVLSVFRDGYEIGTTAVLLGSQEKPTPTGVYPITQKDLHHVSNLYDAKMPYMLRLTNDGVTIHATSVARGFASHGCVGVPLDFAQRLFATAKLGDKVYITRGKSAGLGSPLAG